MIDLLVDIVEGSRDPYKGSKSTVLKQPSYFPPETPLVNNTCWNYMLIANDTCQPISPFQNYYFEIIWQPVQYLDEIEQEENFDGEIILFYKKKTARLAFSCLVDELLLSQLHELSMLDKVGLSVTDSDGQPTGTLWNIFDMQFELTDQTDIIQLVISFRVDDSVDIRTACCGGLYEDAPFEPCPNLPAPLSELFLPPAEVDFFLLVVIQLVPHLTQATADAQYQMYKNGVRLIWLPLADLDTLGDQTNWSFDDAGNTVHVPASDPMFPGDQYLIIDLTP